MKWHWLFYFKATGTIGIINLGILHSCSVSNSSMYYMCYNCSSSSQGRSLAWRNMSLPFRAVHLQMERALNHLNSCQFCKLPLPYHSLQSSSPFNWIWSQRMWLHQNTKLHLLLPIYTYVRINFLWAYQCTEAHSHSIGHWPGRF